MKKSGTKSWLRVALCGLGLLTALSVTGCQVTVGGQTLPSPYYLEDDVQFFPEGPEMKLSAEAAAMKRFKAQQQLQGQ